MLSDYPHESINSETKDTQPKKIKTISNKCPINYHCFKCKCIGEHWIMECPETRKDILVVDKPYASNPDIYQIHSMKTPQNATLNDCSNTKDILNTTHTNETETNDEIQTEDSKENIITFELKQVLLCIIVIINVLTAFSLTFIWTVYTSFLLSYISVIVGIKIGYQSVIENIIKIALKFCITIKMILVWIRNVFFKFCGIIKWCWVGFVDNVIVPIYNVLVFICLGVYCYGCYVFKPISRAMPVAFISKGRINQKIYPNRKFKYSDCFQ